MTASSVAGFVRRFLRGLGVHPTGTRVRSRWRAGGDVSESRSVRYAVAGGHGRAPWDGVAVARPRRSGR